VDTTAKIALSAGGVVLLAAGTLAAQVLITRQRAGPVVRPDFTLDYLARAGHAEPPLEVAMLGDSTVEGVGVLRERDTLGAQTARQAAALLGQPVHIKGYGVSGARAQDVLTEQLPRLRAGRTPDHVVVVVGANDATRLSSARGYEQRMRSIVDEVRDIAPSAKITLATVPGFRAARALPQPFRTLVDRQAGRLRERQADIAASVPGVRVADIYTRPTPRFEANPKAIGPDGFHPSRVGYGYWADELGPVVAQPHRPQATARQRPDAAA